MGKSPMGLSGEGSQGEGRQRSKEGGQAGCCSPGSEDMDGGVGGEEAPPPTHAWMRLARSWGAVLAPGAAMGFWLLEIIPDMLQKGGGDP